MDKEDGAGKAEGAFVDFAPAFTHRVRVNVKKQAKGYAFDVTAEVGDNGRPIEETLHELAKTLDGTIMEARLQVARQERQDRGEGYSTGHSVEDDEF